MRVVGVSRVLNEADVIEAFIRHHATLLDLHILLDNGSTDGTIDILRALHAEGVPLQVYQTQSPLFMEQAYNTGLYRLALQEAADWVFYLDADELLVMRDAARLAEILALAPPGIICLRLPGFRYERPRPAPNEHPFGALLRRAAEPEMHKIAVRRIDPARIHIAAGNHFAFVDGREDAGLSQDRLLLAHVPDRSPLQLACKVILGRLKPMASGEAAAGFFSVHCVPDFEALKTDPRGWLDRAETRPAGAVEDPVAYRGGPLRYPAAADDLARMIALLAAQAEILARSHGAILDRKRLLKRDLMQKATEARRLF